MFELSASLSFRLAIFIFGTLCPGHLELSIPSTNLLIVQTFKRHYFFYFLYLFFDIILQCLTILLSCLICVYVYYEYYFYLRFHLFWFSLKKIFFSICFLWFILLLPIVCFPFSSSASQSVLYLKIQHTVFNFFTYFLRFYLW